MGPLNAPLTQERVVNKACCTPREQWPQEIELHSTRASKYPPTRRGSERMRKRHTWNLFSILPNSHVQRLSESLATLNATMNAEREGEVAEMARIKIEGAEARKQTLAVSQPSHQWCDRRI